MIKIIRIPCGIVNCYLIEQNGAFLLVDTAFKKDYKHIEESLLAVGISPTDLHLIFLTHGHIDHAGSAPYFQQYYQLPIALNSLEDDTNRPFSGKGITNKAIWTLTRATLQRRGPLRPDIFLQKKQNLKEYGFDARVIPLPGHTAGSMGLLLPDGSLMCGDLFSGLTNPRLSYVAEDSKELQLSAQKLQHERIKTVYPGHGIPFEFSRLEFPSETQRAAIQNI